MNLPNTTTGVTRENFDGVSIVQYSNSTLTKYDITVQAQAGDDEYSVLSKLINAAKERNATIISQDVFGPCNLFTGGISTINNEFGNIDWPISWLEGDGLECDKISSAQARAISNDKVKRVQYNNSIAGTTFEDEYAKYCFLANIQPKDSSKSRNRQTQEVFESIEEILLQANMTFTNVVRTWLYVDRILEWYDDLNGIRTDFFTTQDIFKNLLPASTGIGIVNPNKTALVANVLAIQPKNEAMSMKTVTSPLQCSAEDYKSSFSRALLIDTPEIKRLNISGTASIAPEGETMYVGDIEKQVEQTAKVVNAILESQGFDWKDISKCNAYFKHSKDFHVLDEYCKKNNIPSLPVAIAQANICRDNLLFELEANAIKC